MSLNRCSPQRSTRRPARSLWFRRRVASGPRPRWRTSQRLGKLTHKAPPIPGQQHFTDARQLRALIRRARARLRKRPLPSAAAFAVAVSARCCRRQANRQANARTGGIRSATHGRHDTDIPGRTRNRPCRHSGRRPASKVARRIHHANSPPATRSQPPGGGLPDRSRTRHELECTIVLTEIAPITGAFNEEI